MKLSSYGVMTDEMFCKVRKDVIERYDMLSGKQTSDLKTMEVTIIVAIKDAKSQIA